MLAHVNLYINRAGLFDSISSPLPDPDPAAAAPPPSQAVVVSGFSLSGCISHEPVEAEALHYTSGGTTPSKCTFRC